MVSQNSAETRFSVSGPATSSPAEVPVTSSVPGVAESQATCNEEMVDTARDVSTLIGNEFADSRQCINSFAPLEYLDIRLRDGQHVLLAKGLFDSGAYVSVIWSDVNAIDRQGKNMRNRWFAPSKPTWSH